MNDSFGSRGELRRLGGQWVERCGFGGGVEDACVTQKTGEAEHPQPRAHLVKHLTPGKHARWQMLKKVHLGRELIHKDRLI